MHISIHFSVSNSTGRFRGHAGCIPPFGVHHKNPLTNVEKPDEN